MVFKVRTCLANARQVLISRMAQKNRFAFIILGILVFANLFAWSVVYNLNRPHPLEVIFFDIGQGDAIFIETPQRQQILIDGGPSSAILEKLAKEMPFYDRDLDLIILSHPEKDHLAGLLEVLKRYKVENILWTGVIRDTIEWREWAELIKKERAEIKIAKAGQRVRLGEKDPAIFLDVLYPAEKLEGKELEDSNDVSIVSRLVFGKSSFLFTGDINDLAEKEIIGMNIDSDVLKIAHHGSKNSSSEEFLKIVSPDIAVISVGKNNYGHPNPDVLARLKNFGIETLTTQEKGDIKIISDGKDLKLITNN